MQNASKKAWILRSKIEENALKIALKIHALLDVVFRGILGGFGRGLGRVSEALLATFLDFFRTFYDILTISMKNWILEAFWRGLGRLLGGFWEAFGRVWEPLGRFLLVFCNFGVFWCFLLFFVVCLLFFIVSCSCTAVFSGHSFPLACVRVCACVRVYVCTCMRVSACMRVCVCARFAEFSRMLLDCARVRLADIAGTCHYDCCRDMSSRMFLQQQL